MQRHPLRASATLFVALLFLAACGGGDGGGGTPPAATPITGTFVDSPVNGLHYTSPPSNPAGGFTTNGGQYQCMPGDTVTFDLGGRTIGTGQPCGPLVTVVSVFGATSTADTRVMNLSRLLLTLGGIPSGQNPIELPATIPADLPNPLDFSDPNFTTVLQTALPGATLVTKAQAIAYLHTSFKTLSVAAVNGEMVTSNPAGITCTAGDCSYDLVTRTADTLTATGTGFTGWSGDGCSGTGTCQIMLDAIKAVRALFLAGFTLHTSGATVAAPRDSSGLLRVHIERQSGFSSPIKIDVANPPTGISADPVIVEADDEAQVPLHIAADVAIGVHRLVIRGTSGVARTTVTVQIDVQAAQPRSPQLIQDALDAGQIDYGTSLLYRAYAVFGSARLPAAFVGSGGDKEDSSLFVDIELARPTLPPAILDQLEPFLRRPDDPQSVFNAGQPTASRQRLTAALAPVSPPPLVCTGPRGEWITARSELYPVRAWALCIGTTAGNDTALSNLAKVLFVVDQAYGKMTALMGPAVPDLYGDEADEAIDVYAVPPIFVDVPRERGNYAVQTVRGVTIPQPPYVGRRSSGYVMLPTWEMAKTEHPLTLIHELFHVLQFAHTNQLGRYWFTEASADWAAVHFNRIAPVPPADNGKWHREDFGGFQKTPDSLLSTAGVHEYDSYIWPFFMEQEAFASPIGSAWKQFGSVTTDEQATGVLDSLLPFKSNFRVFAVRNVNEPLMPGNPVAKRYHALDDTFPDGESLPRYDKHNLIGNTPVTRPVDLGALMAGYLRFDVGENSGVQSVEFDFSGLSGREHLDVDALIRTSNGWVAKPVPLDDTPRPRFCFDLGPSTETVRGSFIELRLVLSNHAFAVGDVVTGSLRVRPSRGGCAGWAGTTLWSHQSSVPGSSSDTSALATVTFEVDENASTTPGVVQYKIQSGRVSYRSEVTTSTCRELATSDIEMLPDATSGPGSTLATLATFSTQGTPQYGAITGATFGDIVVVTNCTADGSEETIIHPNSVIPWWNVSGTYTLKNKGALMEEDITAQAGDQRTRNQWSLQKLGK